jgi:Holliday junction resolvase RusA-like endonuclease
MQTREYKCRIDIKPLSVNAAWKGRRFKTAEYQQYERDMEILLPRDNQHWDEPIEVDYVFYLKNAARTDVDNLIKPLQDILVRTEIITDDRLIMSMNATKIKDQRDRVEITIRPYAGN